MGNIIDISHHQNPAKMDYDVLSKQVEYVIIRTQYGSRVIDRHYKTHHREFQKRGIPTAAYAWVRGISIWDMKREAEDFYHRTKLFHPDTWFLDVEERSMSDMRRGISAYVKKLRALGATKVGIYIGHHLYASFNLDLDQVDVVWIPHYGRNTGKVSSRPAYPCDLHQYTSKGRLRGYNGYLDLNRWMKEEIIFKEEYTIKPGDTLWGISKRKGVTIEALIRWNHIKDPDRIYAGEKLTYKERLMGVYWLRVQKN